MIRAFEKVASARWAKELEKRHGVIRLPGIAPFAKSPAKFIQESVNLKNKYRPYAANPSEDLAKKYGQKIHEKLLAERKQYVKDPNTIAYNFLERRKKRIKAGQKV